MTRQLDNHIDVALVKEFYANLYDLEDKSPRQVRVRGKLIKFDMATLNEFLETLVVLELGERYSTYSRFYHTHPNPQELATRLCIPGQGFVLNTKGVPWKLLRKDLTTLAQTWSVLSYSNLTPTSHTSNLNMGRARLVYGLVMKMDMDVGSIISGQISQMVQSNSSRLVFPALITALCIARGFVSDSLAFESLSPAINLAYIQKNCWNPKDPMITFPRSRKARAWGPSDASTFSPAPTPAPAPAPIPTTTLTAPSDPSTSSTNTIVLMLHSLHHGLCLVMQSIHDLAQHQPIISMEDFVAQVAWPGVQPSLAGGGEASTTQEPEATPKETPVATPMEVADEGDGTVNTNYMADITTVKGTWDPWPTPAQDTTPLPAQDAPTSPQDDPTPAQEE